MHVLFRRILLPCLLLCLALLVFSAPALALKQEIVLPEDTTAIEDYAFSGCTDIIDVSLPEGLLSIGAYAFADCPNLPGIYIPSSVQYIGENAFHRDTELLFESGSYAETWAQENDYNQPTQYYAVLVGQEYLGLGDETELPGCFRDVDSMAAMLGTMTATPYQVTVCKDATASGILSAINTAFADARRNDVCLFYYSGHGANSASQEYLGALVGVDMDYITMARLKAALDATAARKVIVLDSCYSGAGIEGTSLRTPAGGSVDFEAINAAIISAFSPTSRSALADYGYYVLTAASATETSVSAGTTVDGEVIYFGAFTYGLLRGSGYNEITGKPISTLYADDNNDNRIGLTECFTYSYAQAQSINADQHAQCFPVGSALTLWGR